MAKQKPHLARHYESKRREEVSAAFAADKKRLRLEGYVPVEERWSEPDREIPGIGLTWRYLTHRLQPEHPELVKLSNSAPTERLHRLEVRYAPVDQAARSQGGTLDITVTENGRCPACKGPTMQMPRPPFERYCNPCQAEYPA